MANLYRNAHSLDLEVGSKVTLAYIDEGHLSIHRKLRCYILLEPDFTIEKQEYDCGDALLTIKRSDGSKGFSFGTSLTDLVAREGFPGYGLGTHSSPDDFTPAKTDKQVFDSGFFTERRVEEAKKAYLDAITKEREKFVELCETNRILEEKLGESSKKLAIINKQINEPDTKPLSPEERASERFFSDDRIGKAIVKYLQTIENIETAKAKWKRREDKIINQATKLNQLFSQKANIQLMNKTLIISIASLQNDKRNLEEAILKLQDTCRGMDLELQLADTQVQQMREEIRRAGEVLPLINQVSALYQKNFPK